MLGTIVVNESIQLCIYIRCSNMHMQPYRSSDMYSILVYIYIVVSQQELKLSYIYLDYIT